MIISFFRESTRIALIAITVALSAHLSTDAKETDMSPFEYHQRFMQTLPAQMTFRGEASPDVWAAQLRSKLCQILAVPEAQDSELNADVRLLSEKADHKLYKISYTAEEGVRVPGYLLIPKQGKPPYPVMICLQGHVSEGMKLSLNPNAKGGRGFAVAAIKNGWAALAIEQRCFGERKGDCQRESLHALMLGKTLTGERVLDVIRAVDFVETRDELDATRIGCMGQSTGGTVTFYSACLDKRIRLAVVSCSYCAYAESWMKTKHCPCGYLPGILKYADMGDLGGLVAPRDILIVAGKTDPLASLSGVQQAFKRTKELFDVFQFPERARLIVGDGGHDFFPELTWPVITEVKKRWKSLDGAGEQSSAGDALKAAPEEQR